MSLPEQTTTRRDRPWRRRIVLSIVVAIIAAGGWWHRYVHAAYARLSYRFVRLDGPGDVRYQPGQEDRARHVAGFLDSARQTIESTLHITLAPPPVYCLSTEDSYSAFTAAPGSRGMCTMLGEVCLSPRIRDESTELRGILVHEMTHAALLQQIGPWKQLRKVPAWFDEGLAVFISGGGGAEKVSENEAREAILDDRCFNPARMGKNYAVGFGLTPHLFYRQAGMFVGHLENEKPGTVTTLVTELRNGLEFPDAFERAVGMPIDVAWRQFKELLTRR